MGKVTRERCTGKLRSWLAMVVIRHELTLTELSSKRGVHQTLIAQWKRRVVEGMTVPFLGEQTPEACASPVEVEKLHA